MALSTLSSLNGNYKTNKRRIAFSNQRFFNPDIPNSAQTLNIYQTSSESSSVIPQWTVYGDIKFNNGPTVSTSSVSVIDSSKAILLDATESYPLSYIQQLMFLPAGDYIISLYEIIFDFPTYAPSNSYIKISFGSIVILDNYIAANYSDWSQLNF